MPHPAALTHPVASPRRPGPTPQNDASNAGEWPVLEVMDRCPTAEWAGQDPYPTPDQFQADYPVVPDIYPGRRLLPGFGGSRHLGAAALRLCGREAWEGGRAGCRHDVQ